MDAHGCPRTCISIRIIKLRYVIIDITYTKLDNFFLNISRFGSFLIFGGSMFQSFILAGTNEMAYVWILAFIGARLHLALVASCLLCRQFYEDICAWGLALRDFSVSLDFATFFYYHFSKTTGSFPVIVDKSCSLSLYHFQYILKNQVTLTDYVPNRWGIFYYGSDVSW